MLSYEQVVDRHERILGRIHPYNMDEIASNPLTPQSTHTQTHTCIDWTVFEDPVTTIQLYLQSLRWIKSPLHIQPSLAVRLEGKWAVGSEARSATLTLPTLQDNGVLYPGGHFVYNSTPSLDPSQHQSTVTVVLNSEIKVVHKVPSCSRVLADIVNNNLGSNCSGERNWHRYWNSSLRSNCCWESFWHIHRK
jgi:hypothetical protein